MLEEMLSWKCLRDKLREAKLEMLDKYECYKS